MACRPPLPKNFPFEIDVRVACQRGNGSHTYVQKREKNAQNRFDMNRRIKVIYDRLYSPGAAGRLHIAIQK